MPKIANATSASAVQDGASTWWRKEPLDRAVVLKPETLSIWASFAYQGRSIEFMPGPDCELLREAHEAWQEVRRGVFARDGGKCRYCGRVHRSLSWHVHIDHVHPKSQGGNDLPDNLVVACRRCNLSKGAASVDDWRAAQANKKAVQEHCAHLKALKGDGQAGKDRRQRVRKNPCPDCGVPAGAYCIGANGQKRKSNHAGRDKLVRRLK